METEVSVIFGASGGIGSALAIHLTKEGKKVVLCSRNADRLASLSSELNQPYIVCNGSSEEEVVTAVDKILTEYGRIDAVANCIGSFFIKPLRLTTLTEWNEVLRVNLTSSFCILKGCLEKMEPQKQGSIVLISSVAAEIGLMHHEAIAAAKGAIEALVRSAAASYAQKGIRINGVAPGLVDTLLSSPITSSESALKASLSFHPLGRIGKAEDIVSAITWLLSPASSWVTGEVISVDGGLTHIKTKVLV